MRILGIGEYCDLGDMYFRLMKAGHEVQVFVENPNSHDVFGGMVHRVPSWLEELEWIRQAGKDGIIVFESALKGVLQDQLRHDGFQVVGGSQYGDRLEGDREFGQAELRDIGLATAFGEEFSDFTAGVAFLRKRPGRYVFKYNGADSLRTKNYIGQAPDAEDVIALLEMYQAQNKKKSPPHFVLMEFINGVEVGVGAYFNGRQFLRPACLDWEHKRFFPGDLGELTGEMGTIVTYDHSETIFTATLAKMEDKLRSGGYCGYINLNLIANKDGLWPLEFTSRFGYPGFAICDALHLERWDSILLKMLGNGGSQINTKPGFACGVVLSVPPFPYAFGYSELSKGAPIFLPKSLSDEDRENLHFCEVEEVKGQLLASGTTGCIAVATGSGPSIEVARAKANGLAGRVIVPNLRYRTDIGSNLISRDWGLLDGWGYV
jgi:phosphoribosylamine--glycine ligase